MKSLIKNIFDHINEQIDYGDYPERMDPGTERRLGNPEQNLFGDNPAMPQGSLDVERLASDRFKKVVDKLRGAINQPNLTPQHVQALIMQEFASSVQNAKRIELRFNEELEELAVQAALKATETPEGRYNIDAKLTGSEIEGIDPEKFQLEPKPKPQFGNKPEQPGQPEQPNQEENPDRFDPNILTKDESFNLEVHKRNIINSIIQGASKKGHYIFQEPEIKAKIDQFDPNLYGYYLKLMAINDYFYFTMDELIQMAGETGAGIGGREDVTSNKPPQGPGGGDEEDENGEGKEGGEGESEEGHEVSEHNIKARGIIFPMLCHEVIKGIEEALAKFGYSNDPEIATAVIGQTDTLPNEAMSLRIGPELVEHIRKHLPNEMFDEQNVGIKPFFYSILYQIPATDFLKLIGKVVSQEEGDNNMAVQKFREIFQQAKSMRERYNQKRAQGNVEPEQPERQAPEIQREPEVEKKPVDMNQKLAAMGLNALNVEMNSAIDAGNWELAQQIQRMIERKQGNQR